MNERAQRIERAFEVPILVAALLVIPVIAVEQSGPGGAVDDDRDGDELAHLARLRRGSRRHARRRPRSPRLLVVVRYARRIFTLTGLRYVALLAPLTALGGGAAFAAAEGREVSTWDGVWWAVTTMTTVGYGDLTPATDLGRAIAMAVMVVGIGFLTLLIAAAAERFVATGLEQEVGELERGVDVTLTEGRKWTPHAGRPSTSACACQAVVRR